MDISEILASRAAKQQSTAVEKDVPLQVDAGFMTVTDSNPIDEESYQTDLEKYLLSTARDGVQTLLGTLFSLSTVPSQDGPLAQLPPPTTLLPRAKPLPKPKPPTKWERFAAAKGIQHKKRDRKVWDEERQEWTDRWGRGGKNKQLEEQWLTEVPHNADIDHDPAKIARNERKERVAKNERQRLQNIDASATTGRDHRKVEIEKTLATTRVSTASLGRFDKQLEGEKKTRGVKRKFEPTETRVEKEKQSSLALIAKMESDSKKMGREPTEGESVLNVRKAVRFASKGKGGIALAQSAKGRSNGRGSRTGPVNRGSRKQR